MSRVSSVMVTQDSREPFVGTLKCQLSFVAFPLMYAPNHEYRNVSITSGVLKIELSIPYLWIFNWSWICVFVFPSFPGGSHVWSGLRSLLTRLSE